MPTLFTAPRDGRSPVTERLTWMTDVQVARSGAERRSSLRPYPRHGLEFTALLHTPSARASLETVRSGVEVLVPLWQHIFERPATAPDAGLQASHGVALVDHAGTITQDASPVAWPEWAELAAPLARARLLTDSRSIEHDTYSVATAGLSLQLLGYVENPGAYTGPTSGGLPLLDPFTETGQAFSEDSSFSTNSADPGWADGLLEVRHVKKQVSCEITLRNRAEILAFRRLLFALAGRRNPLRWTPPGISGATEGTYRLASDEVELVYLKPDIATCSLTFTKL